MTLYAIFPKVSLVNIVLPMTGNAIRLKLCRVLCFCMASRTDQSLVLAGERKLRREIMVKRPDLPSSNRVAARAV